MSAEAIENALWPPPAATLNAVCAQSLREAALGARRTQKTTDSHPSRSSKLVLSRRRHANYLKIVCFPLGSFSARLESPRGSHFGHFLASRTASGATWTLKYRWEASPNGAPKYQHKLKINTNNTTDHTKHEKRKSSLPKVP